MVRTATNVAGQALVPVIVAKRNAILDQRVYDGDVVLGDADADPTVLAVEIEEREPQPV